MSIQDNCIFCRIIRGEIPSKKVMETEDVLAFHDINPVAATHVLLIPKKHIPTMNDVSPSDWHYLAKIHELSQQIARDLEIADSGYRLINNCGENGGQEVFHLHYHLLGGERLGPMIAPKA